MPIDYADYGTKLATPNEIAAIEKMPVRDVLTELATEQGKDYYSAIANTVVYLKSALLVKIHGDPEAIKLLKSLEEINKASRVLESKESSQDRLPAICDKLGVETLDEALAAIDSLKHTLAEIYHRLDTGTPQETLFAIDMLLQK